MCAIPVRWCLRRLLPMKIGRKMLFSGPGLAFSAGPLEGLGVDISYWVQGLGYGPLHRARARMAHLQGRGCKSDGQSNETVPFWYSVLQII